MHIEGDAVLLRMFIGESDKHGHRALSDVIVQEARAKGLAGATVLRGVTGFGPSARIRSSRVLDLSSDLPIVVEIVDREDRLMEFLERVNELLEEAGCGGLITLEKARVLRYITAPGR